MVQLLLIFGVIILLQTGLFNEESHTFEPNSLLIFYDGYYDTVTRKAILETAQPRLLNRFTVEKRPNLISDFDVIHGYRLNGSIFKTHQRISNVLKNPAKHVGRFFKALSNEANSTKRLRIRQITDLLSADRLWANGYTGKDIDVAVFDTGLMRRRLFFRNVKSIRDFTSDRNPTDKNGHGSFVAGIIACSRRSCSGFAPHANLHIYKTVTDNQVSTTAWFLDAFNAALQENVNIINLSIGGPDFTDRPFMDKVTEVTAAGIIIVSAIGNDGPDYGTISNPGDQGFVIGVGGINIEDHMARFSSRGMTTSQLSEGYGFVKPDIVTYSTHVYAASLNGGCQLSSGTSVATPVVTGALALVLSSLPPEKRRNVAMIKQILIESAKRLDNAANIFEQGAGKLDLPALFYHAQKYEPKISLFPEYIDYNECPYMWPWCTQPIYHTGLPVIFNLTVYNGFGADGHIRNSPVFEPLNDENGQFIDVSVDYSERIWPWSGYVAVFVKVKSNAADFTGTVSGQIRVTVTTGKRIDTAVFRMRLKIVPTPIKSRRLLWDQFRSIPYPIGYIARDDLSQTRNPLDSNADHPHTNFKPFYEHLRNNDYFVEILGTPVTCLVEDDPMALARYGAYVVIDPEEEYFPNEIELLENAARTQGMSIIAFADWFNATLMQKILILQTSLNEYFNADMAGCNVPALNALLQRFGFAFGDFVANGHLDNVAGNVVKISSGSSLIMAPKSAKLAYGKFNDQGAFMVSASRVVTSAPVLGLDVINGTNGGIIALFSDSSCLETPNFGCFQLFDQILASVEANQIVRSLADDLISSNLPVHSTLPKRFIKSNFANFSKVVYGFDEETNPLYRKLPKCRPWTSAPTVPLKNVTFPIDMNPSKHSLEVIEIERLLGPRLLSNFELLLNKNAAGLPQDNDDNTETLVPSFLFNFFVIFAVVVLVCGAVTARPRLSKLIVKKMVRVVVYLIRKVKI